jgi:hypothetical protein
VDVGLPLRKVRHAEPATHIHTHSIIFTFHLELGKQRLKLTFQDVCMISSLSFCMFVCYVTNPL